MTTKQKALKHYDKMIAWASRQKPRGRVSYPKMIDAINQDWYSDSCSYCEQQREVCSTCPLVSGGNCCGGLWYELHISRTWASWITSAKKVREYIKRNG